MVLLIGLIGASASLMCCATFLWCIAKCHINKQLHFCKNRMAHYLKDANAPFLFIKCYKIT